MGELPIHNNLLPLGGPGIHRGEPLPSRFIPAASGSESEARPADPGQPADGLAGAGPAGPVAPLADALPAESSRLLKWLPSIFCAIWLVGAAIFLVQAARTSLTLVRRFAHGTPVNDPGVQELARECCQRLRVRRVPMIIESDESPSPALYGLLRPLLVLPRSFRSDYSRPELRLILLHEVAHIRRFDLPLNWLIALLQAIHWFNPLVWIGFARWRADRELACDALVLETVGAGHNREYAEMIIRLLEGATRSAPAPGMIGILEDRSQLRRRINLIAHFKPATPWSARGRSA